MSAVIQHTSSTSTSGTLSATFASHVAKGSLIIVAILASFVDSVGSPSDGSNTYFTAIDYGDFTNLRQLDVFYTVTKAAGALTISSTVPAGPTKHMHVFEVAGYDTADQNAGNSQGSTTTPSVSTSEATAHADEFVFAFFADNFGSGVTYTPGSGFSAGETTSGGAVVFSEFREVTSTGVQAASATADAGSPTSSVIVTFYSSSGSGGGGGSTPSPSDTFFLVR